MKINWIIEQNDVKRLKTFVEKNNNPFVQNIINRNVNRKGIKVDKDTLVKTIMMCLITSQQPAGPDSTVGKFIQSKPFPLTYKLLSEINDIQDIIKITMMFSGLNRFINKIPAYFDENFTYLQSTNWELFADIEHKLNGNHSKEDERIIADRIDDTLKGFGPKQSRNFLQALGLSKYEVPIDSRITRWLNEFGFPIQITSNNLLDKEFYHLVLDGFQALCEKAGYFPCVVDAAIFSSFDNGAWTKENVIY